MSYQAHIKDTEYKFNLTDSVSILESAISQGINLPYGCRNGDCGGCKCNVSSGVLIDNDGHTIESLTDVLLCQSLQTVISSSIFQVLTIVSKFVII